MSAEEELHEAKAIMPTLTRWELVMLVIIVIYLHFLVYYAYNFYSVWEPETSILGLPKTIAGAAMVFLSWIALNYVLFAVYHVSLRKRIKAFKGVIK
jgi:TRAP-type C4-dicarboxylate transport system permease small subunit